MRLVDQTMNIVGVPRAWPVYSLLNTVWNLMFCSCEWADTRKSSITIAINIRPCLEFLVKWQFSEWMGE